MAEPYSNYACRLEIAALTNILTMTPEKGKVATLLGKSFITELIEERKSFQHGILMLI